MLVFGQHPGEQVACLDVAQAGGIGMAHAMTEAELPGDGRRSLHGVPGGHAYLYAQFAQARNQRACIGAHGIAQSDQAQHPQTVRLASGHRQHPHAFGGETGFGAGQLLALVVLHGTQRCDRAGGSLDRAPRSSLHAVGRLAAPGAGVEGKEGGPLGVLRGPGPGTDPLQHGQIDRILRRLVAGEGGGTEYVFVARPGRQGSHGRKREPVLRQGAGLVGDQRVHGGSVLHCGQSGEQHAPPSQ